MRPQGLPQSALLGPPGPAGPQFAHPHIKGGISPSACTTLRWRSGRTPTSMSSDGAHRSGASLGSVAGPSSYGGAQSSTSACAAQPDPQQPGAWCRGPRPQDRRGLSVKAAPSLRGRSHGRSCSLSVFSLDLEPELKAFTQPWEHMAH